MDINYEKVGLDFQTPIPVCRYMVSMVPEKAMTILEPTKGMGNIVSLLGRFQVTAPDNFFDMAKSRFDCVLMNPPFSAKYAYGVPDAIQKSGMRLGYHILTECMQMSDCVIALMPWFTISDSDIRLRRLKKWGLKSVTALPRKTFQYARIQTVVLELVKGWDVETVFKVYDLLNYKKEKELFN